MRCSRDQWRKRVEQWRGSGKTARVFAKELGLNFATFKHWVYTIGRENRGVPRRGHVAGERGRKGQAMKSGSAISLNSLVELQPAARGSDGRLEVELSCGRIVRVPTGFDVRVLTDIVRALEGEQ